MNDDLTEYLRLLNCAVRRVVQAKHDGYDMTTQATMLTEGLRNVMLLGGPLPSHLQKAAAIREALDDNCPTPNLEGENRGTRRDQCFGLPAD